MAISPKRQLTSAIASERKLRAKTRVALSAHKRAADKVERARLKMYKAGHRVEPRHLADAREWVGTAAPARVINAKARCYAWNNWAPHSEADRLKHKRDLAITQDYEERNRLGKWSGTVESFTAWNRARSPSKVGFARPSLKKK